MPARKTDAPADTPPSALIDAHLLALPDWRGALLARLRALILAADPRIVEEWKWAIPVWSCHGILCTGEVYQRVVKLTFPKGASLDDPAGLFNASLEGRVRRAIDFAEDASVDEAAFQRLIRTAIAANTSARR